VSESCCTVVTGIVYQRRTDGNIYVLGVFYGALDLKRHLQLKDSGEQ